MPCGGKGPAWGCLYVVKSVFSYLTWSFEKKSIFLLQKSTIYLPPLLKQDFGPKKKPKKSIFSHDHVRYEKTLLITYKPPQAGPFPPHDMWETFKPFSKSAKNTIFFSGWGDLTCQTLYRFFTGRL